MVSIERVCMVCGLRLPRGGLKGRMIVSTNGLKEWSERVYGLYRKVVIKVVLEGVWLWS